jgi:hypothetical protein
MGAMVEKIYEICNVKIKRSAALINISNNDHLAWLFDFLLFLRMLVCYGV